VQESNNCEDEMFCTRPDWPWGSPYLLYNGYRLSFPGLKQLELRVNHPPPMSEEVEERVKLHIFFPLCAFVECPKVNVSFTFTP